MKKRVWNYGKNTGTFTNGYYHLVLSPGHNGQIDYGSTVYLICKKCIDGVITRTYTSKGWDSTSKMTIDDY